MTTETLPAVLPLEPTTPIQPSEAIRLGCLIAPVQAFADYGWPDGGPACVLGALALGMGDGDTVPSIATSKLIDRPADCPSCGLDSVDNPWGVDPGLEGVLEHLNDDHRWSRERIADWLAGQGL